MKANKPLLIVLSCTRNYGWVTRAFLEGNTRWADYIIIVDQMSTDGTREMCAEYGDKVIIVDDPDMTYKESTRAKMAFEKGREIAGDRDHIFFALDIDEVMPANWMNTEDGKRILNSKPGDEFSLHWANLNPDNKTYFKDDYKDAWTIPYKIFHDELKIVFMESGAQMHTPLLPYTQWELPPYEVKDFPLLHFGSYFTRWNEFKQKYYQVLDVHQRRSRSIVYISRLYDHQGKGMLPELSDVKREWLYCDIDLYATIDTSKTPIFVDYIKEILSVDGIDRYAMLNIWTDELCNLLQVTNPQKWYHRLYNRYIMNTDKYSCCVVIRALDKIIKLLL